MQIFFSSRYVYFCYKIVLGKKLSVKEAFHLSWRQKNMEKVEKDDFDQQMISSPFAGQNTQHMV